LKLVARAAGQLPTGTLSVGAGLAVLGVGSYAHLAIAGHELTIRGMASVSVLWAIVSCLGIGLFFPVEQELIRHVAARTVWGEGVAAAVRRGGVLAGGVLLIVVLPSAAAARPLADRLFGGDIGMMYALYLGLLGVAVGSVGRSVLAGLGRFRVYGTQLGLDGSMRVVLSVALALARVHSPTAYGLVLTAAPLLSVACTLRPTLRGLGTGSPIPWPVMCRGFGMLIGSSLLAQTVVNVAVIDVDLLAPGRPAVVGALLAAMVLARVPIFVFASLQAALLPGLASAAAAGDFRRFRLLLRQTSAAVAALGLAGGVLATVFGPWLGPILFGVRHVLHWSDFALLGFGSACYMLALVLGQGAIALGRHRDQLLSWVAGGVVLAVVTLLPGEVRLRVEFAYAASSLTVAVLLGIVLVRHRARFTPTVSGSGTSGASRAVVYGRQL
jgi:O-antigen/teichoic acid export membrane protein